MKYNKIMNMKMNTLLIIVILLASVALVASGCLKKPVTPPVNQNQKSNPATTTSEIDTSNWKTYRNEQYGFGFKYPKDWEATLLNDGRLSLKPIGKKGYEYVGDVIVTVRPMGSVTSVMSFYSNESFDPFRIADYVVEKNNNRDVYYFRNFLGMVSSDLYVFAVDNLALEFNVYNSQNSVAKKILGSIENF